MVLLTRVKRGGADAGSFEDGGDIETEGPVGVDGLEVGGAEMGERLVADGVAARC
jgi:hypothetical protein